jgi:4-hydroxy-tetrahydrodipicolinate reductase
MRIALNGAGGKVGRVLAPALVEAGHELAELPDAEAMVDFTVPAAVAGNVGAAIAAGVPSVVGTTGWEPTAVDEPARAAGVAVLYAPNFAVGAVLMMRFAEEAAKLLPRVEIVELHHESKRDAPSGTAKATAARIGGEVPIHSVRLPGLVAHQEVIFGGEGQTLSIRHDSIDRRSFMPGVVLAVRKVAGMDERFVVGLENLL